MTEKLVSVPPEKISRRERKAEPSNEK